MELSHNFSNQRILVTGASGFIGSHLSRQLSRRGAEVHGVSRQAISSDQDGIRWWQGELSDSARVQKLLKEIKPDFIFHLASHVVGTRGLDAVMPTFLSNLSSTVNLLTAAAEMGCGRMLLTGSLEEPPPGDAQAVPCSPYAVAKWAGATYARMFHQLYQLPIVILRLFMVYGPAQKDLQKLVPHVTLSLLRGEAPKLSSGTRLVDWIYVDDVVDGLLAAARADGLDGNTVDLGTGELYGRV